MPRDLTDVEVARELGMHPRSIQRRCQAGKLPGSYKAGRSWRIPRRALKAAGLEKAFRPPDSESELAAATRKCRELQAEMEEARRLGRGVVRGDWRSLVRELADLQEALEVLPRDSSELPSWLLWRARR